MLSIPLVFSIIVPVYNAGEKLRDTLSSVVAQQFSDAETRYEVLVMDGGSTDDTLAIAREFEARNPGVRVYSEPDEGIYDAMNTAIRLARGQYLHFLGAGDILRQGVLEALISHIPAGDMVLIYGDVFLCDEQRIFGGPFSTAKLRNWNPPHQGIFYHRTVFERLGTYELKYPLSADYAFNMTCWGDNRVRKCYVPLVIADYEGGGASVQRRDSKFERDKMRLIRARLGRRAYWLRRLEVLMPTPLKQARLRLLRHLHRPTGFPHLSKTER
jgi:glycosyltransferase involved in cell wall biosynthesis